MAQPLLGVVASAVVMAVALGYIWLFDFPWFTGSVSFFMLGLIPMQIVMVVLWGANPSFASSLRQPLKGVVLTLVAVVAALVIMPIALRLVGEGVQPPGPIPSHFVVIVVPTTFYLAIMFGGWPFTRAIKDPIVAGLVLLVAAYVITYVGFRLFFNYDFLQGGPVYLQSAPRGLFNGVSALVFYVTVLAVMFLVLCFDLWPLTRSAALMKQPVLGLVWLVIAFAGAAVVMWITVGLMGMDPMIVLTRVTAPIIFGAIIVLNMLQNSLFQRMAQPVKGVLNAVAAVSIGVALANLYGALAPRSPVAGALVSGAPGYEYEIWLVNALLSVTFPFLVFYAACFGFWPLTRPTPSPGTPART
ncbi:MAG TPA: hypothetical protein VGF24_10290 [Vicinamibacterales bacterium]|jgi:hypothetical protein